ncbi:MAG: hypothetical protein IJE88_03265, partial [Akkermansia sp.]|nr:hypothetical protein [Akkermansia sp.]
MHQMDGFIPLTVSGKDAEFVIDGAVVDFGVWGAAIDVGGADGNGKFVMKNGAVMDNWTGYSFFIGYSGELEEDMASQLGFMNGHATTATTSGDYTKVEDRYVGNYTDAQNGSGVKFGRGEVLVTGKSTMIAGKLGGGIFMGEGSLTVEDESYVYINGASFFGRQAGSTSIVNISSGSVLDMTGELIAGSYKEWTGADKSSDNIDVNITVNNATIRIGDHLYMSMDGDVRNNTMINLCNNSTVTANEAYIGSDGENSKASVIVGTGSTLKTTSTEVRNGNVRILDKGTVKSDTFDIYNRGIVSVESADSVLTTGMLTVHAGGTMQAAGGDPIEVDSDVTVNEGGIISLKNGSTLSAKALTMAAGSIIKLSGNYSSGDMLVSSDDLDVNGVTVTMDNGQVNYTIEDGVVYLTAVFDNSIAEALTVTNWGIATASRTFVNAVRGQRTNTGCIADGRGTAWAAVLGGTSDIGSGDVDLKGAAVGADMKVGEKSSLGVAFGYIDGDAKIPGMSKA